MVQKLLSFHRGSGWEVPDSATLSEQIRRGSPRQVEHPGWSFWTNAAPFILTGGQNFWTLVSLTNSKLELATQSHSEADLPKGKRLSLSLWDLPFFL